MMGSWLLAFGLSFSMANPNYRHLLSGSVQFHSNNVASEVDYAWLAKRQDLLSQVLTEMSAVSAADYEQWDEAQRLAFLINAYNAFTLDLILTEYPDLDSIRDLGSVFRSPWKKAFFELLGESRSLDDVEHGMIREWFAEPRIHVAVNCASCGCPALLDEPFVAAKLDQQLDMAMRQFLADPERNRWDPDRATLFLSPLFDWYGEDFEKAAGSVWNYVQPYRQELGLPAEQIDPPRIRFTDYDWSLNDLDQCRG